MGNKAKKWNELREAIGPGELMTKRRSAVALAAWSRHAGTHNPGTHKPDFDDTEEQLEEYEEEEAENDEQQEG